MNDRDQRIYLLLPTRLRPAWLARAVGSAKDTASHPDRVVPLLQVDEDDTTDYSAYPRVRSGPRFGYAGLHYYMNGLARWAMEDTNPHWQVMYNDDERMVTSGWDEKLLAYGGDPKVVFMRRDMYAYDTAYPAWPRSFFEITDSVGDGCSCDSWLAQATGAADRLIGRTTTHVHAADIAVAHDRDETDPSWAITRRDTTPPPPDVKAPFQEAAFRLADRYAAGGYAPPFGMDSGVPLVRR